MSATDAGKLHRLLTFAPMIDSELARQLLRHYGVTYREDDHLFGWVSLLTMRYGGFLQVPMLHGAGVRLDGPREIAEHFDPTAPADKRLLPPEQPLRTAIDADWQRYNGSLASDTAAVSYFYMLPERSVMVPLFQRSLKRGEARIVPTVYAALRWLFTVLLGLQQAKINDAMLRIRMAFDATDRRIADGRPFLTGHRLTLGDLALATAAAPLLLPEGYTAPVPVYDQMPAPLRALVDELRTHPTASFVARIYAGSIG
jgi:glutathione S-transferase